MLDIDASVKPVYGRHEGAELGYNPNKRGRCSHTLHTFWVGNLRLVLDVNVSSGKQHTSAHGKAALGQLLDELGDRRPAMVRGDSGYGRSWSLLQGLDEQSLTGQTGTQRPVHIWHSHYRARRWRRVALSQCSQQSCTPSVLCWCVTAELLSRSPSVLTACVLSGQ